MALVGDMLRLARQLRGFTQKDAAVRLGIAQPVLSRLENGVADPDEATLQKAASGYSLPRQFFDLRETVYGPPVSVHPMARAKAEVTGRDLDMVTAELNIRVMQMRRFLEGVDFEPKLALPYLDPERHESPEAISAILRGHWALSSGPVRNLTALVEAAGVVVGLSAFGGASISGMTFRVPGQPPLILLNVHHPADRLRFTLAHELGHLVMHRVPTPDMESEANAFASAFLMPKREIEEAFVGRKITLDLLAALKPEWKVAMQALLMRAKGLGYLDYNQNRYLWQQISSRGWRLREPAELDFDCERPQVLASMIDAHLGVLGYSVDELSQFVPLYKEEFSKMYGLVDKPPPLRPRLRLIS